jgi:hypothetical protein
MRCLFCENTDEVKQRRVSGRGNITNTAKRCVQFPFSKPSLHNQKPTCSFILITVDMQVLRHQISGAINPTYFAGGGKGYRVAGIRKNEGSGLVNSSGISLSC